MNSRLQRYAMVVAIFVVASMLLAFAATQFLRTQFGRIEDRQVKQDVTRVVNAAHTRVDSLTTLVTDWARWDDPYEFMGDGNQEFIDENLDDETLATLKLNFMIFVDRQGNVFHTKGVDLRTGKEVGVLTQLVESFTGSSKLLATSENSAFGGFLNINNTPLAFAARSIIKSDYSGPYRGTLIFAQYLTPETVKRAANLEDLSLSYEVIGDAHHHDETIDLRSSEPTVSIPSNNLIVGHQLLTGVDGTPLFAAHVEQRRDVYLESQRALTYYLIASVLVVVIATFMAMYSTRQMIAKDDVIRLKDEFFSIASHDIRTPLTAIRGNSRLLQQIYGDRNDEDFQRITEDIHSSSERLIRLVNNYLDLARLEQNRIPLNIEDFALVDSLQTILGELSSLAADKNLELKVHIPKELPLITADQERVKQIVYNLVGNSLKFTDHGSVTIEAQPEGRFVRVCVTDTGRGIPPAARRRMFKKFEQSRNADADVGSGLGLYISKVMVEKMGGRIKVASSVIGKGTTICFTLPSAKQ